MKRTKLLDALTYQRIASVKIQNVEGTLITSEGETSLGLPEGLSIIGSNIVFHFRVPKGKLVGKLRHGAKHRIRMGEGVWLLNIDLDSDIRPKDEVTIVQAVSVHAEPVTEHIPLPDELKGLR